MSKLVQVARFDRSMETLEIGDVLVCERRGVKWFALVKWIHENRSTRWYELSQFGTSMNFIGSRMVTLNYAGWLEDLYGQVVLTCEEWKHTLKDVYVGEDIYAFCNSLAESRKQEPTLKILIVGSKSFRDEATAILEAISKGNMSKDEAVKFLKRALHEE